jgi:hypothetical protein
MLCRQGGIVVVPELDANLWVHIPALKPEG